MQNRNFMTPMKQGMILALTAILLTGCGSAPEQTVATTSTETQETTASEQEAIVGLANPWRDCTVEEAEAACDRLFRLPADVTGDWRIMENVEAGERPLVEANFEYDGMTYCARAQQGVAEEKDIAGLYYEWTVSDEDNNLFSWNLSAKTYRYVGDDTMVDLITWYDPEQKIAYALSTESNDLEGFDIIAIAEALCPESTSFADNTANVNYTYSEDQTICIKQDLDTNMAVIIDGDETIPVEITWCGQYDPEIAKTDVDGDGEEEYVLSVCEGSGSGFHIRSLVIVDQVNGEYRKTTYSPEYFQEILQERVSFQYDPELFTVTFTVNNPGESFDQSIVLERAKTDGTELADVVWSDITVIRIIDGMPYVTAPAGCVFSDSVVPDFCAIDLMAPIAVDTDSVITVGDFELMAQ